MERHFLPMMMLACMTVMGASCNDENTSTTDGTMNNNASKETLYKLFPDANNITWSVKGDYVVADSMRIQTYIRHGSTTRETGI